MNRLVKLLLLAVVILTLLLIWTSGATGQTCVEPPANLLSWWPGDGNPDDIYGTNPGIMVGNAGYGPGMVDQGFSLPGSVAVPSRVEILDSPDLRFTDEFTLEAWVSFNGVSPQSTGVSNSPIIAKWGSTANYTAGYGLVVFANGAVALAVSTSGNDVISITSPNLLPIGTLTHVAGVWTGSQLQIYMDGVCCVTGAFNGPLHVNYGIPLLIGGYSPGLTGVADSMIGIIDEASVYTRALEPSEIEAIYNAGSAGKCKEAPNEAPIAVAGDDQAVHQGELVTLDGSGSTDPDENYPLEYSWQILSMPAGSTAELADADTVNPSFVADKVGDYEVELVVTDSLGLESMPDVVVVSTTNTAPVADAGPDQAVIEIGTTVQLDGSKSYDFDGDPITFAWSFVVMPAGSLAELSDPEAEQPTFVADVHGDFVIALEVNDGFVDSDPDTVTVSFDNVQPVADAGENQSVWVWDSVDLDGGGSWDANLDPLTYSWSLVSKPEGSGAELSSTTEVQTGFVADVPGDYVVSLVVNDGFVDSEPANVTVTAVVTEELVAQVLMDAVDAINGLLPSDLKNKNMKKPLTNKLNAVLKMIDQGKYQEARDKLTCDILKKMDGCAAGGAPDKNDWIITCACQNAVYPLIVSAIELLDYLLAP